ncbi:hypothetical protein CALCODRAFT_481066 [Calocera cornea HHB12733]|uniref:Uncharacterized protein n=1 Tax=Calocera cornea HHB12733 TaxID=1353952 RepID=A0A165I0K1_9BASI|nr:hypothetical protein CALCODRAFT_481066 [Calocera cornea HHB12733]
MKSFSVLNFRRGRKATNRPSPAPPVPDKPASPASFFSPGSPLLELAPHLPPEMRDAKSDVETPPSDATTIVKPPRPPRINTPELNLDLSFDSTFSMPELFLVRNSSTSALEEKISEGAVREIESYNMLQANGRPVHDTDPSQASIISSAWTYTSDQLQEIVGRAIRSGTDSSSIRLLNPDTLDTDLPEEEERLEAKRDQLKSKFRTNSRRRRLLLRELEQTTDAGSLRRLATELAEENVLSDQLTDELYTVGDLLSQLGRLRDAHCSSALSMALRKLNSSLVRTKAEVLELQTKAGQLEAEREEAWAVAESVEHQLNDLRQQLDEMTQPKAVDEDGLSRSASARSSRVSAARKVSLRASKASLRLSAGRSKSMRSSSSSLLQSLSEESAAANMLVDGETADPDSQSDIPV